MDEFYNSWPDGIRSKAKKLERLKGFFKFCVKRKWIAENPAIDLEAPVGAGTAAHRIPFTDTELTRIYTCDRLPRTEWKNNFGEGAWDDEDVKTMIMLLCWTGLRISDAATFDMRRVTKHPDGGANVFLRMHKTQGVCSRGSTTGSMSAGWPASGDLDVAFLPAAIPSVCKLRRTLAAADQRGFDISGSFECSTPTPHIFRHTFVRLLLQRGVPPRDVAELIGDTEDVVLRHYARRVPERQERLTHILREKLSNAPRGMPADRSQLL